MQQFDFTWPESRLAEAMHLLADRAGLSPNVVDTSTWRTPSDVDSAATSRWLQQAADSMGVEAEPVTSRYSETTTTLGKLAPGLIKLDGDSPEYLAGLGRRGHRLIVLAPNGDTARLPIERVRRWLVQPVEAEFAETIEGVLKHVPSRRQTRTRETLSSELIGGQPLSIGWLLRPAPHAKLTRHASAMSLPVWLTAVVVSHFASVAFWVLSWWLLGWVVFNGRPDGGWIVAWALALLTMVPLRIFTSYAAGMASLRVGAILKQRLMLGSLRLPADQARGRGVGAMLGRVLETESLDGLALAGAMLSLTALVELLGSAVVLACGAAPVWHVSGIVAVACLTGIAIWRYARNYEAWTDHRFSLTLDLVEKMLGHRTRLAQQNQAERHAGEDIALERHVQQSERLDRVNAWLRIGPTRIWMLVGCAALCLSLASKAGTLTAMAVSLGGVMLAAESFRKLGDGLSRLAAARTTWTRIAELRTAAAKAPESVGEPLTGSAVSSESDQQRNVVAEGRSMTYRYPNRSRAVLDDVDLSIRHGDRVLLQGGSGGGKSTLAGLLAGSRDPLGGVLLLGGLDRASLGADAWRRRMVLAPQFQENHIVMGSLAFNLLLGRNWPPTREDLEQAERVCHGLGLGTLLERMPGGLHQIVGETGWQLSHGERSRVFLARALLQDGDLLLLDESFAALDPATQQQAFSFVHETAPAMVVIAHP